MIIRIISAQWADQAFRAASRWIGSPGSITLPAPMIGSIAKT
ncbi:hypothetical protein [Novosphingobium sp. PhB165]|nr:hypothetical protein [Novosphingobium sp. PhB165]